MSNENEKVGVQPSLLDQITRAYSAYHAKIDEAAIFEADAVYDVIIPFLWRAANEGRPAVVIVQQHEPNTLPARTKTRLASDGFLVTQGPTKDKICISGWAPNDDIGKTRNLVLLYTRGRYGCLDVSDERSAQLSLIS